ncbi:MAG: BrnT family toxin [Gammaproteobacteria bacterium]
MFQTPHCFDWDSDKAASNFRKHAVLFEDAARIFDDPLAATRYDIDHGRAEERWVTLGEVDATVLRVVYTLKELDDQTTVIRIISARYPTADEQRQYESGKYRIQEAVMVNKSNPSEWVRGRFYREGAALILPVHVARDIVFTLNTLAKQRGLTPSELANALLKQAISGPVPIVARIGIDAPASLPPHSR